MILKYAVFVYAEDIIWNPAEKWSNLAHIVMFSHLYELFYQMNKGWISGTEWKMFMMGSRRFSWTGFPKVQHWAEQCLSAFLFFADNVESEQQCAPGQFAAKSKCEWVGMRISNFGSFLPLSWEWVAAPSVCAVWGGLARHQHLGRCCTGLRFSLIFMNWYSTSADSGIIFNIKA